MHAYYTVQFIQKLVCHSDYYYLIVENSTRYNSIFSATVQTLAMKNTNLKDGHVMKIVYTELEGMVE